MAKIKFRWIRKEDGYKSKPDNVRDTAYAVIEDYIKRNQHKTAEQLKDDLNFEGDGWNNWDNHGTHPFTIQQHVKTEEYYFSERLRLENDEVIRISKQCWGTTGSMEEDWNRFKNKMDECGYIIEKEIVGKFYWVRKEDGHESWRDGVGPTAYTVIADYIDKNRDKTTEQLKIDLDIWGTRKKGKWDNTGNHPFTLKQHLIDNPPTNEIRRYFDATVSLSNGEEISISTEWGFDDAPMSKWKRLVNKMDKLGYKILPENEASSPPVESRDVVTQKASKEVSLLQELFQIILYGPPGTGKTYRARKVILPQLLGVTESEVDNQQGKRWDIVQFHPSYNYEDFVRGVTVKTVGNNVAYKTVNRTFGEICKRAQDDPDPKNNKYVLIIDEINRANVSAVLGELIYALEYRGSKIKTPYTIDGAEDSMLVIPKNLYIIGTMNTADRTIGQIDYAVRRRFAFVHCPPDADVIDDDDALEVFSEVDAIFDKHISSDYDSADVRIGHSYFLAEDAELARKIVYQVVPILQEYVKDGILMKDAEADILKIKNDFNDSATTGDVSGGQSERDLAKKEYNLSHFYYWEKESDVVIGRRSESAQDDDIRRCCVVSIQEVEGRCNWDSCHELGFILESGVPNLDMASKAKGRIKAIKKGDIVFALLLPDSNGNMGVIGMGEVLAKAVPINQFNVNEIPILDCPLSEGKTYGEKFPLAAAEANSVEKCDWMVSVNWKKILLREELEGEARLPRTSFRVNPGKLNIIKRKFEGAK